MPIFDTNKQYKFRMRLMAIKALILISITEHDTPFAAVPPRVFFYLTLTLTLTLTPFAAVPPRVFFYIPFFFYYFF